MPDRPGSTLCQYGPSRRQHGRYTDRPGLPRIKVSSRTVTDDSGNCKHFKTSGVVSRTMPDHAGPSQTFTDNPGPNTARQERYIYNLAITFIWFTVMYPSKCDSEMLKTRFNKRVTFVPSLRVFKTYLKNLILFVM